MVLYGFLVLIHFQIMEQLTLFGLGASGGGDNTNGYGVGGGTQGVSTNVPFEACGGGGGGGHTNAGTTGQTGFVAGGAGGISYGSTDLHFTTIASLFGSAAGPAVVDLLAPVGAEVTAVD